MAKWRFSGCDWHEISKFEDTLPDGTVVTARCEDCDGDMEYFSVKENDVVVIEGELHGKHIGDARMLCELVICMGLDRAMRTDEWRACGQVRQLEAAA